MIAHQQEISPRARIDLPEQPGVGLHDLADDGTQGMFPGAGGGHEGGDVERGDHADEPGPGWRLVGRRPGAPNGHGALGAGGDGAGGVFERVGIAELGDLGLADGEVADDVVEEDGGHGRWVTGL